MKFSEIIDGLKKGLIYSRKSWGGDRFIVMQIPQTVPAEVVPKMTSLPDLAKDIISVLGKDSAQPASISYHDQVIVVKGSRKAAASATYYVPTWEDIFAEDWIVGF